MRFGISKSLLALVVPLSVAACVGQLGGSDGDGDGPKPNPQAEDSGRVTVHRLNRTEYNNTVRDLLGTKLKPALNFPADDFAFGFDNLADTLSLSPVQFELYELTAQTLLDEAMKTAVPSTTTRFEAEVIGSSVGVAVGNAWDLYSNGVIALSGKIQAAGDYKVVVWHETNGWVVGDKTGVPITITAGKTTDFPVKMMPKE